MKHYLKSKDGEIKYTVDMYCEHPNMKNNNTESIGWRLFRRLTDLQQDMLRKKAQRSEYDRTSIRSPST